MTDFTDEQVEQVLEAIAHELSVDDDLAGTFAQRVCRRLRSAPKFRVGEVYAYSGQFSEGSERLAWATGDYPGTNCRRLRLSEHSQAVEDLRDLIADCARGGEIIRGDVASKALAAFDEEIEP